MWYFRDEMQDIRSLLSSHKGGEYKSFLRGDL